MIHDGETGFLVEERDVQGLVHNLKWLIENRESWIPCLEKTRRHIEQEYNAKIQGITISEYLQRSLAVKVIGDQLMIIQV